MVDFFAGGIVLWLLLHVTDAIQALWDLLVRMVFILPDVTALPQVQALAANSLTVVNGCFVMAIVAAGIIVMTQHTVQVRYGADELLPRLVIGFVAANFALPICRELILLCNSFTQAIVGQPLDTSGVFQQLIRILNGSLGNTGEPFLVLCLALMIAVLTGMLLVSAITRIGILVLLVGISPVALACHASPFTEGAAKLWWRSFGGLMATVTLQAFALHTTVVIFLEPSANLAPLGIPADPTGIFNLFMVACLLGGTIKIPSLMRRYVIGGGGGRNPAGAFLRMLLIQRLTGMLRIPLRGAGRTAGRAAAAGATAGRRGAGRGPAATTAVPTTASTVVPYWRPRMPRPTPVRPARQWPTPTTRADAGTSPARPAAPGTTPAPHPRPAWPSTPRPGRGTSGPGPRRRTWP